LFEPSNPHCHLLLSLNWRSDGVQYGVGPVDSIVCLVDNLAQHICFHKICAASILHWGQNGLIAATQSVETPR
jgi:hypothetical protein